jgi:hypothetical protein
VLKLRALASETAEHANIIYSNFPRVLVGQRGVAQSHHRDELVGIGGIRPRT